MLAKQSVLTAIGITLSLGAGAHSASAFAAALTAPSLSASADLYYNFPVEPFELTWGRTRTNNIDTNTNAVLVERMLDDGPALVLTARGSFQSIRSFVATSYDFNLRTGVIRVGYAVPEQDFPGNPNDGVKFGPASDGADYFKYLDAVRKLRADLVTSHAPDLAVAYMKQVETSVLHKTGINAIADSGYRAPATNATPISLQAIAAQDSDVLVDLVSPNGVWIVGTRLTIKGGSLQTLRTALDLGYLSPGVYKLSLKLVPTGGSYKDKYSEMVSEYYVPSYQDAPVEL